MKENSLQFSSSRLLTPTLSHFPHYRALASLSRSVHVLLFSTTALYNLPDNGGLVPARAGHSRHGPDAQQPPWSSAHRPFAYLPQPGPSNRPSFLDEPPLSNQPLKAAPNLRCNTCKQMQPVVTYESRSMLGVITKSCLRCRNRNRINKQCSTRRVARSLSVASAVTSD